MAVEINDLAEAVRMANALLREHEVEPHAYLGLSEEARTETRRMISGQIDYTGVPRSRRVYREQLLKFTEIGMILGVELARAKEARLADGD